MEINSGQALTDNGAENRKVLRRVTLDAVVREGPLGEVTRTEI